MSEPGRIEATLADVDVSKPNIARMYDYFLGGSANFDVDRQAADDFLTAFPGNIEYCRINRAFLGRAVRTLVRDYGIDQFLDLGSGVPTVGNVHEIAQRENPAARVAYVDIEPVAVHHARHLLRSSGSTSVTQADLRDPESVLSAPDVAGLLDFSRPVAVLAVAVLDLIAVDEPTELVAAYRDATARGSAFVFSHGAALSASLQERAGVEEVMRRTSTPDVQFQRSYDDLGRLLSGYTLVEPGLVPSAQWRPDRPITDEAAKSSNAYAAVGLK